MLCDHRRVGVCERCEKFLMDLTCQDAPPHSEVRVRKTSLVVEVDQDVHTRMTVPKMRAVRRVA